MHSSAQSLKAAVLLLFVARLNAESRALTPAAVKAQHPAFWARIGMMLFNNDQELSGASRIAAPHK